MQSLHRGSIFLHNCAPGDSLGQLCPRWGAFGDSVYDSHSPVSLVLPAGPSLLRHILKPVG